MDVQIQKKIVKWGEERDLIPGVPDKQILKVIEEIGELFAAYYREDWPGVIDGIGDTIVTLVILGEQLSMPIDMCVQSALNEIQNRQGKTVDGRFFKEAPTESQQSNTQPLEAKVAELQEALISVQNDYNELITVADLHGSEYDKY